LNFINSVKSKYTKREYRSTLFNFVKYYNTTLEDLLVLSPRDIEQKIINYITNMNARGLSYGYINMVMSSIFHFFDMNDVLLNKKKVSKFMAENKRANKDRAYTHEEIKSLVDSGDFRFRALILLLASTGIRVGSIPGLQIRHLEKKDGNNDGNNNNGSSNIFKVTIYENSGEEYHCFTTPEATKAIDQYLDYRKRASETITPLSPLFRNDFDMSSIQSARKNAKPIILNTLKNILHKRLLKIGLVERHSSTEEYQHQRRNNVPMSHGFRKFWMNQAVKSKLNPEIREMLLGHKIGIASSYYRPTEEDMLAEFEKAIDLLTIDPANRWKRKVEMMEVKKSHYDRLQSELKEFKESFQDKLEEVMDTIQIRTFPMKDIDKELNLSDAEKAESIKRRIQIRKDIDMEKRYKIQ